MDFLDKLNPQQRQAVTAGAGQVLVLAGPGSGKTRVLTQRVAYLIGHEGVRPYQMLAVTFTNKAAREMESRVRKLLGEEATNGLWLGTFHATCARLLRREAENLPFDNAHTVPMSLREGRPLPFDSNFVIFDADDQQNVVKTAIRGLNLDDKTYRPQSVHASISRAKNELIFPADYPTQTYRDEVVKRIYQRYQELLKQSNAVDFDDLLLWTAWLLEENPSVREKYAQRFHQLLVDEYQDTNYAQYVLLKHLASVHRNVFVVADPDQSVYRWRGADYRNVQRFEKDYPDCQTILLEQNYRSKQTILDAAMAVIDRAPHRRRKKLFTERGAGDKVFYYEANDDYGEASFVVDSIVQLVASKQFEAGDCAIMYRTNAQSRLLEEAFLAARLPYRLVGAQRFYGRREVKDIIAYLRLVHNPADEVSLDRVINVPARGIGDKTVLTLHTAARGANVSPSAVLFDLTRGEASPFWAQFTSRAALLLADFGARLANWRAAASTFTISELFDRIAADINYKAYLDDGTEEGAERWENVQELRRLTVEYQSRTLTEFLENVALISDQDTLTDRVGAAQGQNAPTLLTLHAAKGLEFGAVFITGLDDGLIPHSRSFDEVEAMDEERRLFYVGITRAKDRLYLVRCLRRGGRGYSEETLPSRFLDDIPPELLNGRSRAGRRSAQHLLGQRFSNIPSWTTPSTPAPSHALRNEGEAEGLKPAAVKQAQFAAGMRVQHPVWGEGIVLNSRIQDDDETVDVVFESVGIKRLAASLAGLLMADGK
ncbi:MAG: UvrD-helicase domain-containing protein [Anaerolineales bacterium]|nr:UvrD-helicase domain-containing protein [Anaerolineales bacterium]